MRRVVIRWLLRCYPRAWRRRYGVEFAALLRRHPLTPPVILDVLRGALDAYQRHYPTQEGHTTETRFWRRWVALYTLVGLFAGVIHHLVPTILTHILAIETHTSRILDLWAPIGGALYLVLLIAAAWVQWQVLRRLVAHLSRWWIAATIGGTLAALAVMTTDRSYTLLPDALSMSRFALRHLGMPGSVAAGPLLAALLALGYFFVITATVQALVLQRAVANAPWWVVINIAAALAGLATLRVLSALPGLSGDHTRHLELVGLSVNAVLTTVAYAAFGAVSGAGIIGLARRQQPVGGAQVRSSEDLASA